MKKVINLDNYRSKIKEDNKIKDIKLTKEDRIQARNSLIYDDDSYILQMMEEEKEESKQM